MGQDKGLMPLSGKPMITYVLEVLASLSERILIISNQEDYNQFGCSVFKDEYLDKGPLAGIYTGLLNSDTDYNIVVSCDTPFLSGQLLRYLIDKSKGFDVTLPVHLSGTEQLMGIYSKNCLPIFKKEIEADRLKIKTACKQMKYQEIPIGADLDFYNPQIFLNVNSQQDFEAAQSL